LRAISAFHRDHPYVLDVEGVRATIDYEPAESHHRDVRWQLELARAGLVSPQLPGDQCGGVERLQSDPAWKDNVLFNEYFNGDNAAGLGASHQTGWTGLVADMIRRRHGAVLPLGALLRAADSQARVE
jgi:hypothetical protein